MKTKKNPKADLERYRQMFFQIGIVLSLLGVLLALKVNSEVKEIVIPLDESEVTDDFIFVPSTSEAKPLPPPPVMKLHDEIIIVDNTVDIPSPDFIFDDIDDPLPPMNYQDDDSDDDEILVFVTEMPEPPGGIDNLRHWLASNLKYPDEAVGMGLSDRVFINFVVEKDGTISAVKVVRGNYEVLNKEAIRVVKAMPNWKPGKQNGQAKRVAFTVPITFSLH